MFLSDRMAETAVEYGNEMCQGNLEFIDPARIKATFKEFPLYP